MLTLTKHLLRMMKAPQFVTEEMVKLQIAERIRHKQPNRLSYKQPNKLPSNDRKDCNLKALANKIDTTRMPNPAVMMVLTAVGPYAYRRTDGIFVVPIGCLKS